MLVSGLQHTPLQSYPMRVFRTALGISCGHHHYYYYIALWRSYFGKVEPNLENWWDFGRLKWRRKYVAGEETNQVEEQRRNTRRVLETWSVTFSGSGK